jgi:hypothetical protein
MVTDAGAEQAATIIATPIKKTLATFFVIAAPSKQQTQSICCRGALVVGDLTKAAPPGHRLTTQPDVGFVLLNRSLDSEWEIVERPIARQQPFFIVENVDIGREADALGFAEEYDPVLHCVLHCEPVSENQADHSSPI